MYNGEKLLLGDLLVKSGLITRQQLLLALEKQKLSGERLGKILIERNYISETDLLDVLQEQLGIPKVDLFHTALDPETVRSVPEQLARRYQAVAVKKEGRRLTVAMADPINIFAIDDLKLATGCEIVPCLALEDDIMKVINQYYGLENIDEAFENVEVGATQEYREIYDIDEVDEGLVDDAPIVRVVNSIISQAIKARASDIHIEPQEKGLRVRYRIDGVLQEVMSPPKHVQASIISRLKIMAQLDIAERRIPQDGRIEIAVNNRPIDLRISTLPTIFGEKAVIRILDKGNFLVGIDQLGFLPDTKDRFRKLIRQSYGMILVTGPTGCGKTTTLYSALSELNSVDKNIITVEDPVEYRLPGINQVQINPKAGLTFANGLRSILRQDPNIIMVGEIRDLETADIAIRAALTGHLVLSTMHTNDAAGALTRLIDMGVEPFLVASAVIGVVAQRLVRTVCPNCRESYQVPAAAPERLALQIPDEEALVLYRGRGCGQCNNTGYHGRLAIHEIMEVTPKIRELVNKKASSDIIKDAAVGQGMRTLMEAGRAKVLSGGTTWQEVLRAAFVDEK
ncbi:type II secretion system ATPase GspE [Thermincola ferriacetica]